MKSTTVVRWGTVALMIGAIAGCGGGSSSSAPAAGAGGGAAAVSGAPAGTAVVTAAAAAPATTNTAANPNQAFGLIATVGAAPVTIQSPPVVNFTVIDSSGKFVPGLKLVVPAGTADPACLSPTSVVATSTTGNVTFAMAKLNQPTSGPSTWQSLISRQRLAANTATQFSVLEGTTDPKPTATVVNPDTAVTDPSTRIVGILEENAAGGYYTYRFATDVVTPLAIADAVAGKGGVSGKVANNGNVVVKDGKTIYRVGAQLCYTDPASKAAVVVNPIMDFTIGADGVAVPVKAADGKTITDARKVVDKDSCNECHSTLKVHGTRVDPNYCVICHNAGSTDYNTNNPIELNLMVHKIHFGEPLKELFGQTFKVASADFSEVTYPQPITNCVKCHSASKKNSAGNAAAQGDNWKAVPSRKACGACHSGIDFASGNGATIADAEADVLAGSAVGTTKTGHVGKVQASDTACALCHGAADIVTYHVTVDPTGANGRGGYPLNTAANTPTAGFPSGQGPSIPLASQVGTLPAGVFKIDFDIKQVTVTGAAGAKKATVVYRVLKDGQPVTFNATGFLMANVDGTPDIYVSYATAQDGIAAPADWNASKSAHIIDIRDAKSGNSQTGPDASGYYTAKLGATIPDDAKMVTAGMGINYNGFVQLGLPAYPKGIRLREPQFVTKLADGFTARRSIVSNAKCNNCHGQLGIAPSFHSGARNNGEGCAFGGCHDANKATGHVGAANSFGGGWSVAIKNMVHSIHGSSKRAQAFTYEATTANPTGFQKVTYPGVLKNCEQCHVAGSYDFSGAANKAALPNLLWTSDAVGNMLNDATTNPTGIASVGLSPWVTTLGKGQINYTADNLVSSPIASACFGCHDSGLAVTHMQLQGGTLLGLFSSVSSVATRPAIGTASTMMFTRNESCVLCHGSGKAQDIKVMHAQ